MEAALTSLQEALQCRSPTGRPGGAEPLWVLGTRVNAELLLRPMFSLSC